MDTEEIVGWVWIGIYVPAFLFTSFGLVDRKESIFIKAKGPLPSLLFHNLLLCLLVVGVALYLILHHPCAMLLYTVAVLINEVALVFILRLWILLFRFRIANKLVAERGKPPENILMGKDSWFVRHRHLMTSSFVFRIFLILNVLILAVPVLIGIYNGVIESSSDDCSHKERAVFFYAYITFAFWTILIITFGCLLASQQSDAFGVKRQLRNEMMTNVLACFAIIIVSAELGGETSIITIACIIIVAAIGSFYIHTVKPLWLAYLYRYDEADFKELDQIKTLDDLLKFEMGFSSFLSYCQREFAQENVLFWKAVDDFKIKYGKVDYQALDRYDMAFAEVERIMSTYVYEMSPSQINLSSDARDAVIAAFNREKAASRSRQNTLISSQSPVPVRTESDAANVHTAAAAGDNNAPTKPALTIVVQNDGLGGIDLRGSSSTARLSSSSGSSSSATALGYIPGHTESVSVSSVLTAPLVVTVQPNTDSSSRPSSAISVVTTEAPTLQSPPSPARAGDSKPPILIRTTSQVSGKSDAQTPRKLNKKEFLTTLSLVNIFEEATNEVYHLMQDDLLPRYLTSQEFQHFVKEVRRQQSEKRKSFSRFSRRSSKSRSKREKSRSEIRGSFTSPDADWETPPATGEVPVSVIVQESMRIANEQTAAAVALAVVKGGTESKRPPSTKHSRDKSNSKVPQHTRDSSNSKHHRRDKSGKSRSDIGGDGELIELDAAPILDQFSARSSTYNNAARSANS